MYSIIRVPDGANCLRCQKTTSCLFNFHPSQTSPSPPSASFKESITSSANLHKVKIQESLPFLFLFLPMIAQTNSKIKVAFFCPISSPSLVASDLTLTNTKYGEGMVTLANAVSVILKVMPLLEEMFSHPRQNLSSDHRQITITTHLTCLPISSLSSLFRRPPFC